LSRIGREGLGDEAAVRRRHLRFAARAAVVDLDRAHQAAALADLGEQVTDEVGGGRLAVGARDGEDAHPVARGRNEAGSPESTPRRAGLDRDDLRQGSRGVLAATTTATAPRCLASAMNFAGRCFRAGRGDEQVARLNAPGVFCDAGDFDVGNASERQLGIKCRSRA
jgi:hypothetical protein